MKKKQEPYRVKNKRKMEPNRRKKSQKYENINKIINNYFPKNQEDL
jgi:hypothetical protein